MNQLEQVILETLGSAAANVTHWSRASMVEKFGLSKSAVGRIWKAFDLRPHLAEKLRLSTDPLFVEKIHGFVGLHLKPPEFVVVLCVDEKM